MSDANGSTGGGGRGQGGSGRFGGRVRRGRANLWRSPVGAVAVGIAATVYWSTVAWLVAARTSASLVEVDNIGLVDELEMGLGADDYGNDGTGRLPPVMGGDEEGLRNDGCPWWHQGERSLAPKHFDVPGYRPLSFGIRRLGLATDLPDMTLLDRRY